MAAKIYRMGNKRRLREAVRIAGCLASADQAERKACKPDAIALCNSTGCGAT